ncbi:30S ribosomal protein S15 [Candidatus Schneideria nysicola]|uniref:30S ribosomal protein S15 n=1 Tax=Candidatus Schneideria nysicola TaxID=1081631 RepID=UPI001CAA6080|nr:30S ribosomal protein S15 [Candidatus Schneideria nysicola]UAJ65893.1 30S ribosomal protein S15 [Candidatus Schneideria nysicola]
MLNSTQNNREIIANFGHNENDSGSVEVQVAFFTAKINALQNNHFVTHKKDFHSRKGLLYLVSQRRKLLNYLRKKNVNRYTNLIDKLDLRH